MLYIYIYILGINYATEVQSQVRGP